MPGENRDPGSSRGYLRGDFEFFHLKDQKNLQFEFHHHDFNKIVVFISGKVTYLIEGTSYRLKPWDILLVSSGELHKPIVEQGGMYERVVIWLNPAFLEDHNSPDCDLAACFSLAAETNCNLLRPGPELLEMLRSNLAQLEEACKSDEFGSRIMKNSLLLQFIVRLNRLFSKTGESRALSDIKFDKSISAVLAHINENLGADLSVENLASAFYMSRYYLMHKFKLQTGYSLHSYILQKRLIMASNLLCKGKQAREACSECGFDDYSSFVRAFKKKYGQSPRNYCRSISAQSNENTNAFHILD